MPGRARVRKALGILVGVSLATVALGYAAQLNITADSLTTFTSDDGPTPTVSPSGSASPTPTPTPTQTALGSGVVDSYVDQDDSGQDASNDNFGNAAVLAVRSRRNSANNVRNARAFIRFTMPSLPAGAVVQSATLRVRMTSAPSPARIHQVCRVPELAINGNWVENLITWDIQPSLVEAPAAANPPSFTCPTGSPTATTATNTVLSWNVTSDVNFFRTNPLLNFGWRIKDTVEALASDGANSGHDSLYDSSECTAAGCFVPTLTILYTTP